MAVSWCQILFRNISMSGSGASRRKIATSATFCVNYYDALGVTPSATQNDIKAAYYKLSMLYHPDKNKGSPEAAQKFRDITEAYEVLGNFRLRKLYDKGIIHTAGAQYTDVTHHESHDEIKKDDDPQTKFYKARMKRSEVPHSTGRTPIYDFDEWSRVHYGESFDRKQAAKNKYERKMQQGQRDQQSLRMEYILLGMIVCLLGLFTMAYDEVTLDSVKKKSGEEKNETRES